MYILILTGLLFILGLITIYTSFSKNRSNKGHNKTASTSTTLSDQSSLKNKEELKKVFGTFDKNGDGFITSQELRESLRNLRIFMSDKEIDDIVVKFDSNGDGLIDFQEFCKCFLTAGSMIKEESQEKLEDEDEEENLKEAFGVFDKNRDGLISVEELALVLTSLGLIREGNNKIQDCKDMIRKIDADGDGMVDFNEFKKMMKPGSLLFTSS